MKKVKYIIIAIILLFNMNSIFAQTLEDTIKSSLPKMLGASNWGTEFYFTIPPCFIDESTGGANFIKIFITSTTSTQVVVEIEGNGFYQTKKTIPNDVIEFNLTPVKGQPYIKGGKDPNVPEAVFPGKGIHVVADQPMLVYCVVRFNYTSDGFLAIPVSSLGKKYIVAGWNVDAMFRAVWNYKLPNTCGIVAPYDDTRVKFTLGGNKQTRTAGGMISGDSMEVILRKGDVWMLSTDADDADLSGSRVISNKPVAVVTGNMCANIPIGNQWCDYTVEMDIPAMSWSQNLHLPKVPNRKYSSIIRIFAKEPKTTFYKDGIKLGEIKLAGGKEGDAFVTMRMVPFEETPRSIVISGDKPINVVLYNTGVQEDGYPLPNSDPFVMSIHPYENYYKQLIFCTPGIYGGMGFPENYLNLVYQCDTNGNVTDDFEFANVIEGKFNWAKLDSLFPGKGEIFSYNVDGKKYAVKTITLLKDGVYQIRANSKFAAYSFGYSYCDSYGYPAGGVLPDNEKSDTSSPVPSYHVWCDGSVSGGTITDAPDDSKIRTNLSIIFMNGNESNNYDFMYNPFIAGETRTTTWRLGVIDPSKDAKATLVFSDRRGNDTAIVVNYYALKLRAIPKIQDFGLIKIGSNQESIEFEVFNESKTTTAFLAFLRLKNEKQNFNIDLLGKKLPVILEPEEKFLFKVWFDTKDVGVFKDSIGVGDSCLFVYQSEVKAEVGEPVIQVSSLDFGWIKVDSSVTKSLEIKNTGNYPLNVSSISGPTNSVFSIDFSSVLIQPNSSYKLNVSFKPNSVTEYMDSIRFHSDAINDKTDSYSLLTGWGFIPSGIEQSDKMITELFPNPSDKQVTIKLIDKDENIIAVQLIDEKGSLLVEKTGINTGDYLLNIEQFPSGNYFIKLRISNGVELIKKLTVLK